MFKNPSYHIYAINYVADGQIVKPDLNFEQFIYEPNLDNLNKIQR